MSAQDWSNGELAGRGPKRSLYQRLFDQLQGAILSGVLEQGTVLLEGALAKSLGSSRAPVRQALGLLDDHGLISRFEGRGYVVGTAGTPARRVDLAAVLSAVPEDGARSTFAWQAVYDDAERRIVQQSFFGRYRINEVELARHYDVGRTVARDVLQRLEVLGIAEKESNFRWAIVPLDEQRIADLYELRAQIEPLAIGRAMDATPATVIGRMLMRLEEALEAYPEISADLMYDLELDLHVRCLKACPNRELPKVLQRTHCVLTLSKHVLGSRIAMPQYEPFMAEHVRVLQKMQRGDRNGLVEAMRHHIEDSQRKVTERAAEVRRSAAPDACAFLS